MKRVVLLLVFAAFALPAFGQTPSTPPTGNPVTAALNGSFATISRFLTASGEKMPEANYAFKPTPEVMSFGELLGHVANTHYSYCSRVKGEKNPNEGNDIQKKTTKAEIQKGLADSIAYCAAVYKEMTDAQLLEPRPAPVGAAPAASPELQAARAKLQALESRSGPAHPDVVIAKRTVAELEAKSAGQGQAPPPPQPKLGRLMGNVTHDWEHYGNIVTYLRIKGLVPPSSEPRR